MENLLQTVSSPSIPPQSVVEDGIAKIRQSLHHVTRRFLVAYKTRKNLGEIKHCKITAQSLSIYAKELQKSVLCFANNPDTPGEMLDYLSSNCSRKIVEAIALNSNTPVRTLCRLARHKNPDIRAAVAENTHTPLTIVMDLCKDTSIEVRYSIAENPLIPAPIIHVLLEDENPYVVSRATKTLVRVEEEELKLKPSFKN